MTIQRVEAATVYTLTSDMMTGEPDGGREKEQR